MRARHALGAAVVADTWDAAEPTGAVRAGVTFGSRDELLWILFERHSPIPDFEDALDTATDDLTATELAANFVRALATDSTKYVVQH